MFRYNNSMDSEEEIGKQLRRIKKSWMVPRVVDAILEQLVEFSTDCHERQERKRLKRMRKRQNKKYPGKHLEVEEVEDLQVNDEENITEDPEVTAIEEVTEQDKRYNMP